MIQIGALAATIDSPIEHLMACHRRIEQRLDTLTAAAGHVTTNKTAAVDAIRKSLQFLDTSGVLHTEDEEASVFPRLRQKLSASDLEFIDSLETQHIEAGSLVSKLKEAALELEFSGEPSAGLLARYLDHARRLRSLYREHIRAEDEILTAIARRSLNDSEIGEISREMRTRREKSKAL